MRTSLRLLILVLFGLFSSTAAIIRKTTSTTTTTTPMTTTTISTVDGAAAGRAELRLASSAAAGAASSSSSSSSPAQGLQDMFRELREAVRSSLTSSTPISGLVTVLAELLKAAEGVLLPQPEEQEAARLTASLRSVVREQAMLRDRLAALQFVAEQGTLQPRELTSLRDVAQTLFERYQQLEALGRQILQSLRDLFTRLFPDLSEVIPPADDAADQQQQNEEAVLRSARSLFPDILN